VTAPDPRLDAIKDTWAAASKGPWEATRGATADGSEVCTTYEQKSEFLALSLNSGRSPLWLVTNGEVIPAVTGDGPRAKANATAIANAPAHVTHLLSVVEAQAGQIAKVRELADKWAAESNGLGLDLSEDDFDRGWHGARRDITDQLRAALAPEGPET